MLIRRISKISLLIISIVVFSILVNFIIQIKIQDIESQSSNDDLIKIVTKKAESEIMKQNEEEINNRKETKIEDVEKTEYTKEINENVQKTEHIKEIKEDVQNNDEEKKAYEKLEIKEEKDSIEQKIQAISKDTNTINTKDKIDWNKLNSINKDIVGWIEIPNTNINYPILKDENLYYLNHNYEGKNNRNGSIFIRNRDLFESKEITIYGHNMKNGTMFAKLENYINKSFLTNNSKLYIYTKENTYEGHIFTAYSKGVNEEKEAIKSLNLAERVEYYKNMGESSEKTENNIDKIVKLTTCSYINARTSPTNQRYYVIAEMIKIN